MEDNCGIVDKYASNNLISSKKNNFLAFRELIESKSYVSLPNALLDHILTNNKLSELEKLSYLTIYSLSFINLHHSKHRSIGLSAVKLGKIVGCSKSQILAIEKSLSDKGYLRVIKQKNKFGQDNCNLLSPTLPVEVFSVLSATPDRRGLFLPFNAKEETQLSHLERTKQYIPLNYQIFKLVSSCTKLTSRAKILWLAAYTKAYKNTMTSDYKDSKQYDSDEPSTEISFTSSYVELASELNCSHGVITSNMNLLVEEGFLNKKRFHVKNGSDLQDRCDKSLWHITITLPAAYKKQIEAIEDRRGYKPKDKKQDEKKSNEHHASEYCVSNNLGIINSANNEQENTNTLISDPDTSLFRPHLIKALKINRKNRSSERADFQDFEKEKNKQQKEEKIDICGIQKTMIVEKQILNKSENNESESSLNQNNHNHEADETKKSSNQKIYDKKRKSLAEIEPISEEEAIVLRNSSSRDFSCSYMNKLMQKLAKLYPEHGFFSRKLFLAYMEKTLIKELRETTKANNIDFRFKQEVDVKKREKYLEEVETSFDASDVARLKKKIAGVFDAETAYHILTSVQFGNNQEKEIDNQIVQDVQRNNQYKENCDAQKKEDPDVSGYHIIQTPQIFSIKLKKELTLTQLEQEMLLGQVKSVYGNKIMKLEFKKIEYKKSVQCSVNSDSNINSNKLKDKQTLIEEALTEAKKGSIWHKVSQNIIAKHGIDVYKAWFSQDKMKANYDEVRKTLSLKASMNFIASYVQSHYFSDIYDTCKQENCQLDQIS